MRKLLTITCILFFGLTFAQEKGVEQETKEERQQRYIEEANPFRKNGYRPTIATLSNGKYREAFPDTIVQVGSFTYNKRSKNITGFYTTEETQPSESTLRPDLFSRWMSPDPLSEEFPDWSPYNFVENNPLRYIDPEGLSPVDIIDIEVSTGEITITEAAGDDIVRSVDNGEVQASYTYGENGSFQSENTLIGDKNSGAQTVVTSNTEKANEFFEFAADNSNVEFGYLEVSKEGSNVSVVSTTFDQEKNTIQNDLANELANNGFEIIKHSHNHPGQEIGIPSGYFGIQEGNPNSLTPIPNFKQGDAEAARVLRRKKQFKNTEFSIYNGKTKTIYDGTKKAKVVSNN